MELLPVLLKPADFDEALACFSKAREEQAAGSSSPQQASAATPSIVDALINLNTQCTVFKRSADKLGKACCINVQALPPRGS